MLLVNWTNTLIITVVGFCIVFIILTILVLVFTLFGKIMSGKGQTEVKVATPAATIPSKSEEVSDLDNAAIATALGLYFNDAHDKESYKLSINRVSRRYSPWNAKIFGLNNLNK